MTEIILGQVRFVLVTAFWGMILMAGYDICRFLRWLLPHHKAVVAIEDICYWCLMSVPTYIVFFIFNEGEIRWYGALAVLLGGVLYEKGISTHIRSFGYHHFTKPKNKVMRFLSKKGKRIFQKQKKKREEYKKRRVKKKQAGEVLKEKDVIEQNMKS